MRLSRSSRVVAALSALACASAVTVGTTAADAAPKKKQDPDVAASYPFRKTVAVKGIQDHLRAFQRIADANDDNRASGLPGYKASRDYVVRQLRNAGYRPQVQTFDFTFFQETTPTELERLTPTPKAYVDGEDFRVMTYSGSGEVEAPVVPVDTDLQPDTASTSGCEPEDFTGFPEGAIALVQRGSCDFAVKVQNAADAGAGAAIVFNRGVDLPDNPGTDVLNGTLGAPADIPALGTDFETGAELGADGTTARVKADVITEDRPTWNVTAETPRGNPSNVIMVGAHLDSVPEGPGINDNGSGSAAILEVAEQLAKKQSSVRNKVRFAWWGAEELGLLGAENYVADLAENNPDALEDIRAYLNFDMVGSPNFARFVYDGDNSLGTGIDGPDGSAQLEDLFTNYFGVKKLANEPTAFDGRSDYGPFLDAGVASGGLFTGAEEIKSQTQVGLYGGTAGEAFDPCYHQACDDIDNIDVTALDQMSDAIAHSVWTLARSTRSLDGLQRQAPGARAAGADEDHLVGHDARR
ncbi:M28 family metallopeptidase [Nocardioides marmoraquaticus]